MSPSCNPLQRPRRNRLTPLGTIEATSYRGTLLANRGDLHAPDGSVHRLWRRTAWVTCTFVEVFGQRVTFDTPSHYTPLFACDEAVAFAAGHRPCAACRRGAFDHFVSCWKVAHGIPSSSFVGAKDIDRVLHSARMVRGRQLRHEAKVGDLPDGTFVLLPEAQERPALLWQGCAYPWGHQGYDAPTACSPRATVTVLTPAPTVAVLAAGYRPMIAMSVTP
ncbi:hypothetical protein GCM10007886_29720 [Methylobacterium gregans]|uniref:Uncharacterized protein n=1 Tax=Methylobacterium gregans TaxID=374424 RepID=A0AA37HP32_9HYPH|nr:hypothetical protein [Methylobacterium gregans]GJD79369.1 hypothetical protein NBEOAGPD_2595 [Methylobacterium gregans]GLS54788.1 hypothetical protein GCM10007886_29720 [Methylobacterium gregans]